MEEWKDIVGYEDCYEVSNLGNVRRKSKNLKQSTSPHGYKTLTLSKDGKYKTKIVHRLVAEAFIDNPENKEHVNHKDCDKVNNAANNLEWVTPKENIDHAIANGRQRDQSGEKNNMAKLSEDNVKHIKKLLNDGISAYEVHKSYYPDLHQQTIYGTKPGRLWKHI